jgi:hypothetical protein
MESDRTSHTVKLRLYEDLLVFRVNDCSNQFDYVSSLHEKALRHRQGEIVHRIVHRVVHRTVKCSEVNREKVQGKIWGEIVITSKVRASR